MKRTTRRLLTFGLTLGVFALIVAIAAARFQSQTTRARVEQQHYTVVEKKNGYELRNYAPYILAKKLQGGEPDFAIFDAFEPLIRYLRHDNTRRTPEGGNEEIPMTTPITLEIVPEGNWFGIVLPSKYTEETVPTPTNADIKIDVRPGGSAAAISFSGWGAIKQMHEYEALLRACLKRDNIEVSGVPIYARFDPPWTLPIFRRNEVVIPVNSGPLPESAPPAKTP